MLKEISSFCSKTKQQKIVGFDGINLLLYLLYYAEACNEFVGPIFVSVNTAFFEKILLLWKAVGSTSNLTGLRFEPQTSCSRDEGIFTRPI